MKKTIAQRNFMHQGSVVHAGEKINLEDKDAKYLAVIGKVSFADSGALRDMEAVADPEKTDSNQGKEQKKTPKGKLRRTPGANA